MKIQKEKFVRFLLYSGFGLLVFVFFLGLTFPFDLAEKQALRLLTSETGCVVTVAQSTYALPVKIRTRGLTGRCPKQRLGLRGRGDLTFQLKSLDMHLALLPLLFEKTLEVDFLIGSAFGNIPGHLRLKEEAEALAVSLRTEGAQLTFEEEDFSALISIQGEGAWQNQDVMKGSGKLLFGITKGRFKSFGGFELPIGEISFSQIDAQAFWKDGRVVLEAFSASGEMADLSSESGVVLLRNPPENSMLAFSLLASPKGSLQEMAELFVQGYTANSPLKIRINGPIRAPQVSVNGKAVRLGL
ncbi:MAG: type II secretion system protein GspN [Nitrospirota bacterium]|nr:type II secretion system protein GspN [Nitrospirota bacterium]